MTIEAVDSRARGLRPRREAETGGAVGFLRRIDWLLLAAVVATLIDPSFYRRYKSVVYGGTLVLMALVLVAGAATRGSHRWINVGFFQFQPSEFGKVFFTLFVAGFLADRAKRLHELAVPLA